MRLEPFLVASLNSKGKWRMLEMGQTRVQNRLYFSSGNGNDLVSRIVEGNGYVECGVVVVNWLLIETCCSAFGFPCLDVLPEIFGNYYYGKMVEIFGMFRGIYKFWN